MATNISWYTIEPRGWWIFRWYEAHYYGPVVSPEDWCKGIIPPTTPKVWSPIASFACTIQPYAGQNITFLSTSYAPNGTIEFVHWSFGDGCESDGFNVTHLYERAGRYNVTITVTDNYGVTKTSWVLVDVFIPSTIEILLGMINLRSKGVWVTAYIELPEGYNVSDIAVSSILLNGTIPVDMSAPAVVGDYDNDGVGDLMVKFNRTQVVEYMLSQGITFGNVTLTLTGELYDGTPLKGETVIRVSPLLGDVNCDGKVDILDILEWAKAFGTVNGEEGFNPTVDVNGDNVIDIMDAVLISLHFGE
jgi:PKD repeat protein